MNEMKELLENQRWVQEQKKRDAERQHDIETDFSNRMNEAAISNANFALRTLVIINGGAAVAILAFLGSLVSADDTEYVSKLPALVGPLMWFVWGTAVAALATGLAYFTNYCIATSSAMKERIWEHPWVNETASSTGWFRSAIFFQIAAVIAFVVSLGFFIYGMTEISCAISKI